MVSLFMFCGDSDYHISYSGVSGDILAFTSQKEVHNKWVPVENKQERLTVALNILQQQIEHGQGFSAFLYKLAEDGELFPSFVDYELHMTPKQERQAREHEWSMGNGQCPVCEGCQPDAFWHTANVGHKKDCTLSAMMQTSGMTCQAEHSNPDAGRDLFQIMRERGI